MNYMPYFTHAEAPRGRDLGLSCRNMLGFGAAFAEHAETPGGAYLRKFLLPQPYWLSIGYLFVSGSNQCLSYSGGRRAEVAHPVGFGVAL